MKSLIKFIKKTPLFIALAAVLVIPMVVNAYAQKEEEQPVVAIAEEPEVAKDTVIEEPKPTPEQPQQPPLVNIVLAAETTEEPVEDPEVPVVDDGVTLGEAQIIATTEHPGSAIASVKTKVLEGNAVYVFKFEDGWKVYVRALDGLVVKTEDGERKDHKCKNKLKDDAKFQAWLSERKSQRKADSPDKDNKSQSEDKSSENKKANYRKHHNKGRNDRR